MDVPTWENTEPVEQSQGKSPTWDETEPIQDEGNLMAAGRGALRNFPFAQQAVATAAPVLNKIGLSDEPTYNAELEHLNKSAEASKAAHAPAYYSGAVGGAAAPAFIPGVGAALEAAPIIGGGVLGAGQAISDTSATKNPAQFAKEAATGAGTGALVGGATKWLGNIMPTQAEATAGATAKKLDIPARRLANILGTEPEAGLVDINTTIRKPIFEDGSSLSQWSDSKLRFAGKVGKAVDTYGERIGDVVKQIKSDIPAEPLMQDIKQMGTTPGGLNLRNKYLDEINETIADNSEKGQLTFQKLRDLTNHVYKEMVTTDPQTGRLMPGSEKALQAWKYLRNLQNEVVKTERPELLKQFVESSNDYSNLVGLQKGLNASGLREEVKQAKPLSGINPLTGIGKVAEGATKLFGLDRLSNTLPIKAMPAINKIRSVTPKSLPLNAAEDLKDFLEKKYGGPK